MRPGRSDRGHAVFASSMDLTRRQVLGLGAVALGALRLPSTAAGRDPRPALFELALAHVPPPPALAASPAGLRGARPLRPRRPALEPRAPTSRRRSAPARTAAAGRAGPPLPHPHGPLDGTDPAFTGAADELQFRLRGERQRSSRPGSCARSRTRRARPRPAPRRPRPFDRPARQLGRRPGPAAQRARATAPCRWRSSITPRGTIEYAPEESPGIVLGHRPLPPRLQRLERHRLQLPRRPLRR